MKLIVVKVNDDCSDGKYEITDEMIAGAPEFDTHGEAVAYCNIINPDALWVIAPKDPEP